MKHKVILLFFSHVSSVSLCSWERVFFQFCLLFSRLLYGAPLLEKWKLTDLSLLYDQQNIGTEILVVFFFLPKAAVHVMLLHKIKQTSACI